LFFLIGVMSVVFSLIMWGFDFAYTILIHELSYKIEALTFPEITVEEFYYKFKKKTIFLNL
jgi:hypothetical protein